MSSNNYNQSSGKRKFLQDMPKENEDYSEHFIEIDKLVQQEQEKEQNGGLSLPKWETSFSNIYSNGNNNNNDSFNNSLNNSGSMNNSINSGSMNSSINSDNYSTITRDNNNNMFIIKTDINQSAAPFLQHQLQHDIPSSHKSTIYGKSNQNNYHHQHYSMTYDNFNSNSNNNTATNTSASSSVNTSCNNSLSNLSKFFNLNSCNNNNNPTTKSNNNNNSSNNNSNNNSNNIETLSNFNDIMKIDNLINHDNSKMTTTTTTTTMMRSPSPPRTPNQQSVLISPITPYDLYNSYKFDKNKLPTSPTKSTRFQQPLSKPTSTSLSNKQGGTNNNLSSMMSTAFSTSHLSSWVWVKNKHSILIIGPTGIGKSFLLNTLLYSTFTPTLNSIRPILGNHRQSTNSNNNNNNTNTTTTQSTPPTTNEYFLLDKLKTRLMKESKGHVDQKNVLDASFYQSINWEKERDNEFERVYITSQYLTKKKPVVNDGHAFILPQGRVGPNQQFKFSYGAICELNVEFLQENEVRVILWELHQHDSDKSIPMNPKRLQSLQWVYSSVVVGAMVDNGSNGVSNGGSGSTNTTSRVKVIEDLNSYWDIPINENVKRLFGKRIQFKGLGKDHNIDRIYIREKVKEVLKLYGCILNLLHIKLPSSVLFNKREITMISDDTKRGNVSKFAITRLLDDADQILLSIDYRGLSADIADLLLASKFTQKFTINDGSVQFIELGEHHQFQQQQQAMTSNNINKSPSSGDLHSFVINQLRKLFKDARNISNIHKILDSFKIIKIKPLLFSSIHLNKSVPPEYKVQGYTSIRQLKEISNIPILIRLMHKANSSSSSDTWNSQHNLLDKFKKGIEKKPSILNSILIEQQQAAAESNSGSSFSSIPIPQQQDIDEQLTNSFKEQLKVENITTPTTPTTTITTTTTTTSSSPSNNNNNNNNNWRNNYNRGVVSPPSGIDRITTSFRTRFAGWKRKLLAYVSSEASESLFTFKSGECERLAKVDWIRFQQMSPDTIVNVNEFCNLVYSTFGGNNAKPDYYALNNPVLLLCKSLLNWTPTFWKENIVERLPVLQEEIISFSKTLLFETNKLLLNRITLPNEEKNQLIKLLSYCQSATDRNIRSKINGISTLFNQNMNLIIYNTCLDTFCTEITNMKFPQPLVNYYSIIDKCFSIVPQAVATKIQQKLIEILRQGLTYLDSIEKHIEYTIQYLLNSPFRLKRQQQLQPDVSGSVIENYVNIVHVPNNTTNTPTSPHSSSLLSNTVNNQQSTSRHNDEMDIENPNKKIKSNNSTVNTTISNTTSPNLLLPSLLSTVQQNQQQQPMIINNDNNSMVTTNTNTTTTTTTTTTNTVKPQFDNGSCNYFIPRQVLPPQTADSLIQICVAKIVQNIHTLTNVKGTTLPEEILQKIITLLITQEKVKGGVSVVSSTNQLDDILLSRLLSPFMQSLDLEGSKLITSASLKTIGSTCTHLKKLSLANCINISTESLNYIASGCKSLEVIILKGCYQLNNPGIVALARGCPNLYVVDLSGCMKITDSAIHELTQNCKQLHTLDLRRCVNLTDAAFQSFNCTTLVNLDLLECNYITDSTLFNICSTSRSIASIKVSGKGITDGSLKKISETLYQSLSTIELILCENITDQGVQLLGKHCRKLSTLNLFSSKNLTSSIFDSGNSSGGSDQQLISASSMDISSNINVGVNWSSLTSLNLNRCIAINDQSILTITNQSTFLETISLAWCADISDESVITIAQRCKQLKNIDLTKCTQITDRGIMEIAKQTRSNLNRLILYSCTLVTDASIIEVANQCPSLVHLDLSQCEKITDQSLLKVSQGLRQLRILCMEECIITDVGVSSLGEITVEGYGCQYLEVIKFGYCRFISDSSLLKLAIGCPFVSNLDLSYCSNLITPRAIRTAIKSWSNLHTLRLRGYQSLSNESIIDSNPLKLKTVNLSWCGNMEDTALIRFVKQCTAIENLDISKCPKITDVSLESILDSCPSIRVINVYGCKEISTFQIQKLSSLGKTMRI